MIKKSSGSAIGTWQYNLIRKFKFDDEHKTFQFTSGRRGPFGLASYIFELHDRIYYNIRETVNRIAQGGGVSPRHVANGAGSGSVDSSSASIERVSSRELLAPPVPPHSKGSKSYHDLHVFMSLSKRSASIPDLCSRSQQRCLNNSIKSSLNSNGSYSSQGETSLSSSFSSSGQNEENEYSEVSSDYQIPKSAAMDDYQVPRHFDDPMQDYQVPRPADETYMVPRPPVWSRGYQQMGRKKIEHYYEDPDLLPCEPLQF